MSMNATRLMLAIAGGLLWAGPALSAVEMRFSEIEARLAAVEEKTASLPEFRTAAFLSDETTVDAIAPNDSMETESSGEEIISSSHTSLDQSSGHGEACQCGTTRRCGAACGNGCQCDDAGNVNMYANVELMFLRAHLAENSVGKLSEKYEFTPRFVVGYETDGGVGARARYWTYGRTTPILSSGDEIRFEFDVLDIEATSRFRTKRSELVVGGGFRFATVDIDYDDEPVSSNMPGITFAADMRTHVCGDCRSEWSAVYGARFSALGGDWDGSDDALVEPTRDDNLITQELYAGAEYVQRFETCNVFARLVFEMQNWHSDALSDSAGADSIGMVGPGLHAGASF